MLDTSSLANSIQLLIRRVVTEELSTVLRCEAYDVVAAPAGGTITVRRPCDTRTLTIPCSASAAAAQPGETVFVLHTAGLSDARAVRF